MTGTLTSKTIKVTGLRLLGELDTYSEGLHQPFSSVLSFVQYYFKAKYNPEVLNYNPLTPQSSASLTININPLRIVKKVIEYTYIGIYVLYDAYYYDNTGLFNFYYGAIEAVKGVVPPPIKPPINISQGINKAIYKWELFAVYPSRYEYSERVDTVSSLPSPLKPNYISLVPIPITNRAYYLDSRKTLSQPYVTPTKTEKVKISYYQHNYLEPIPNLISIEWREYELDFVENQKIYLPITYAVLGTLYVSDQVKLLLTKLPSIANHYRWTDYFPDGLSSLMSYWDSLYTVEVSKQLAIAPNTQSISLIESLVSVSQYETGRTLRRLSANNNYWNQLSLSSIDQDLNFDINHPMMALNPSRTTEYHLLIQAGIEGIGVLKMDSPRLIEIHLALNAEKFATNELNVDEKRVATLGYYIEQIAKFVGHRVNANGEIDKSKEKELIRRIVKPKDKLDEKEYGGSSFGSKGMVVRRVTNVRDKTGIANGGVVAIGDLPQLMLEILDQLNLAIGLQDSSTIEIKHDGIVHKYNSLLELLTEIAIHQFNQSQYARATHISSIVTQEQTKELIGGLGLPTVSKQLQRKVNENNVPIPYWGIAPQASISKKIDTCTYNVGLVLGHII